MSAFLLQLSFLFITLDKQPIPLIRMLCLGHSDYWPILLSPLYPLVASFLRFFWGFHYSWCNLLCLISPNQGKEENLFMVQSKAIITLGYSSYLQQYVIWKSSKHIKQYLNIGKTWKIIWPDTFITSDILYGCLHQLALAHYLDERHFSTVTAQEGKNTT